MVLKTVTINNQKTNFIIAETGEVISKLRQQLKVDISEVANINRFKSETDLEDFKYGFNQTYQALVDANVDFSNVSGIMELK